MKPGIQPLRLAATDLSNHLACRHSTTLDLTVARGERPAPKIHLADLEVIRELGLRHEAAYLNSLRGQGLDVVDLRDLGDGEQSITKTIACLQRGVDVLTQAPLGTGRWFGRPDVLRRIEKPSSLGDWSYEVYDCKLARETKAATLLQLALYSELLAKVQEKEPEFMHVVPPLAGFAAETYRYTDFAAYYRYVKERLETVSQNGNGAGTYPEPCAHCDICVWFPECDTERRRDDHLSLVARITRTQRKQLTAWQCGTVEKLATLPIPLTRKPEHGSKEGYERVREQARVQVKARTDEKPYYELLAVSEGAGLARLPAPSQRDMFLDLEGDPFASDYGRQYLFGFATVEQNRELRCAQRWALTAEKEHRAFVWLVDTIMERWNLDPTMHLYHFGAYEPSTLKRLMSLYATREDEIDRMLRAGLFVDLHTIFKQAVRAGVEEYSLKAIEVFYDFRRATPLSASREAMRYVEHRLELGWAGELPDEVRQTLEGYNEEDCRSTVCLRDWLEAERQKLTNAGAVVRRPEAGNGAPPEELDERQKRVRALVEELVADVPAEPADRSGEQQARWILAQLLDWHRRENKAGWWEGYRLKELDEEELADERASLVGLQFLERTREERKIPVDRFAFERQETDVRAERDVYRQGERVGRVEAIDFGQRTVDIKKTRKSAEVYPTAVYAWDRPFEVKEHAEALFRIGTWVKDNGIDGTGSYYAARDLIRRTGPRLLRGESLDRATEEGLIAGATRIASALDNSVFAIQGPPGSGKTYTAARMICELANQGKKIGITALSHKVIRNLLEEVVVAATEAGFADIRCLQKTDEEPGDRIPVTNDNTEALTALRSGAVNVLGGTSWLWTPEAAFEIVDVLFIDEAGQMALADVIAVAQATRNLVLVGDPQQLERPLKGSHPPGAEKSALEHLLGQHKTIPEDMGMLLPETWRLHPRICEFTSEVFYEGRLVSQALTKDRILEGHPWFDGAGLWYVSVEHAGNRNASAEEVEAVTLIMESLLAKGVTWQEEKGNRRPLGWEDLLVVAPYNAQVADLSVRLPGARIGTVDKFQGQEAPIVIYSLTTSSAEDAPRGMEFLYSLNRLNVATSRAMTAVILVGSPRLLEPDCQNPRQMQLANALCRYREMAKLVEFNGVERRSAPVS